MIYTKDNINGLYFTVAPSGILELDYPEYLNKIEYKEGDLNCTVLYTDKERPSDSGKTKYLLIDVLNYLNSNEWLAAPKETQLADALSALQKVSNVVDSFLTDKAIQYGLTVEQVEKVYYEIDLDSSKCIKVIMVSMQ